jgi:two-component system sensor histidine kinase UhpB
MRFSQLPLLWRVFAINAALLVAATLVLALNPLTISARLAFVEGIDLAVGLAVMLTANLLLLRPTFAPLGRLVGRMRTVDLLRPGQRLAEKGSPEVSELVRAFNEMLERLEAERQESGRRALAAQEGERLRVARGLHDEVGQVLTGVLLQLDALTAAVPRAHRGELEEAQHSVRQAVEEVRRIGQELRPALLEHLGLVSALTELSTAFARRSGVVVERRFATELPPLSAEAELTIYRVAQESPTNVARHAQAGRVELTLERGRESVVLRVADDGRGFDEAASANGHGGLRGMRERAVLAGGVLAVRPRRAGGVEVRLEMPASGLMPIPLVTRILVADDHPIVRTGPRRVLDTEPDLAVVAEAEDGAAVEKALSEDVQLVILDVSMPRITGIQAAAELSKRKPELRILMLSMYESEQFLFEALKAGASGYVLKSNADQDIVEAADGRCAASPFSIPRRSRRWCATTSSAAARTAPTSTSSPHASCRC